MVGCLLFAKDDRWLIRLFTHQFTVRCFFEMISSGGQVSLLIGNSQLQLACVIWNITDKGKVCADIEDPVAKVWTTIVKIRKPYA